MTPDVLGFYRIKGGSAELTTGDKFLDNEMFGVTVVRDHKHDYDAGQCFNSKQ